MEKWFQQAPNIDLNGLDEHYELLFEYDKNGNLKRVRKVRTGMGCSTWIALVFAGILGYAAWYVFFG